MRPKSRGNSFRFWGIWGRVFHGKLYKANCWKTFPWLSVHKNSKRSQSLVKKEILYKQPECFWSFFFFINIRLFPIFVTFQYFFLTVQPKCSWKLWLFFPFFWIYLLQHWFLNPLIINAQPCFPAISSQTVKSRKIWGRVSRLSEPRGKSFYFKDKYIPLLPTYLRHFLQPSENCHFSADSAPNGTNSTPNER